MSVSRNLTDNVVDLLKTSDSWLSSNEIKSILWNGKHIFGTNQRIARMIRSLEFGLVESRMMEGARRLEYRWVGGARAGLEEESFGKFVEFHMVLFQECVKLGSIPVMQIAGRGLINRGQSEKFQKLGIISRKGRSLWFTKEFSDKYPELKIKFPN